MAAEVGMRDNGASEVLGDSWSMLVLRDVIFGNPALLPELLQGSEEGIASDILSSWLTRLVAAACSLGRAARPESRDQGQMSARQEPRSRES